MNNHKKCNSSNIKLTFFIGKIALRLQSKRQMNCNQISSKTLFLSEKQRSVVFIIHSGNIEYRYTLWTF